MHPALMIAVMEERDREIARRTKDAWKRPPEPVRTSTAPRRLQERGRGRLAAAFGRSLALFH
jgi:hypothetical protein